MNSWGNAGDRAGAGIVEQVGTWGDSNTLSSGNASSFGNTSFYQGWYDSASGMTYGAGPYGGMYTPQYQQPQQQSGGMGIMGLLFGGLAGLLGGLFNRDKRDPATASIFDDSLALVPDVATIPDTFVPSYGGPKDAVVPHITGISNTDGRYQVYPRIYGKHRIFPPKAGRVLTELRGDDQYLWAIFGAMGQLAITDIKIGEKPIADFDSDVLQHEIRYGTTSDAAITLYTQDVEEDSIGVTLPYNTEIVRTAGQVADVLSVDLIFPNGLYTTTTGQNGQQSQSTAYVYVKVEYRLHGSGGAWTHAGDIYTAEATSSIVRSNLKWNVSRALYEIRLTRTTSQWNQDTSRDTVLWNILRAFDTTSQPITVSRDKDGNVIGLAHSALQIKSSEELNGNIEAYNYIGSSMLLAWNGSEWALTETASPAWIYADMRCGTFSARPISRDQLDTDNLTAFAAYCTSKGFEYNDVYDTVTTVEEAIKNVLAVGRAREVILPNGKYGVAIDKEQSEVKQIFCQANTEDFELTINWTDIPDALNLRFMNPDANWTMDERAVYAPGKDASNAHKRESRELKGVTLPDMVYKIGMYYHAVARLRRMRYYMTIGLENLTFKEGDKVLLSHDVPRFGFGGALVASLLYDGSSNIRGVKLQNEFTGTFNQTYDITFRLKNNTLISRQFIATGLAQQEFIFTSVIPAATDPTIERNDLAIVGGYIECIVENIEYPADFTARVTLMDYAPGVHSADTGVIPPFQSNVTIVEPTQVVIPKPVVASIRSDESVLNPLANGTLETRVLVELEPSDPRVVTHQYQVRLNGTSKWGKTTNVAAGSNEVFVQGVVDGTIVDIQIRNQTINGTNSEWQQLPPHFVVGKTTPPPSVPVIDRQLDTIVWRYDYASLGVIPPLDFAGFRIRVDMSGQANWANGIIVEGLTQAFSIPRNKLPAGTFSFMIVAVDVVGNESETVAVLQVDFGDPDIVNVIATQTLDPDFALGTKTNCTVTGGELWADESGDLAWSDDNAPVFSGNDDDDYWRTSYMEMTYSYTYVADTTSSVPMQLTVAANFEGDSWRIMYRRLGSNLFWKVTPGADSSPYFGSDDNALVYDEDPPFMMFPGAIMVNQNEQIEFQFIGSASAKVRAKLKNLAFNLDVPDQVENLQNILIPAAGTRLPLSKSYREIQSLKITILYDAAYPDVTRYLVYDKDPSGPLVRLQNAAGTFIDGLIDADIKGVAA